MMLPDMNTPLLWISALAFAILFYGPWQTLCIDVARHKMFKARNAIFDLAAKGDLSFLSPEYINIRQEIEVYIRFSHRIDLFTLLLIITIRLFHGPLTRTVPDMKTSASRIADDITRKEVTAHISQVRRAVIFLILQRSILLMITSVMAVFYLLAKALLKTITKHTCNTFLTKAEFTFNDELRTELAIVSNVVLTEIRDGAEVFEQRNAFPVAA